MQTLSSSEQLPADLQALQAPAAELQEQPDSLASGRIEGSAQKDRAYSEYNDCSVPLQQQVEGGERYFN